MKQTIYDEEEEFKPGYKIWQGVRPYHRRKRGNICLGPAESVWEQVCEYFEWVDNRPRWKKEELVRTQDGPVKTKVKLAKTPYSLEGLRLWLGISISSYNALLLKGDEISSVLETASDIIRVNKYEGGLLGAYNSSLVSKDLGFTDKIESLNVDLEGKAKTANVIKFGDLEIEI